MIRNQMRNVFLIIGSAFPFAILRNIFLGRELNETDMGLMSLLITIISFVYPITLLGQHNALIRFLSKDDNIRQYDWKQYNRNIVYLSGILAGLCSIIFVIVYNLASEIIVFLTIAIIASVIGDLYKEVVRAQGRYEMSLLFQRSDRYIFPIVLLVLYFLHNFKLDIILVSFCIIYILYALNIIIYVHQTCPSGVNKIPLHVHKDGLFFLGLDISLLIVVSIDKFFIAKLTTLEDLAIYFSTFTVMRIYDVASDSMEYVLLPHSNKMKIIELRKFLIPTALAAILVTSFYLTIGPFLINFLYKGKYNQGIPLIPWFCAVGILRLFYIIPSSIIGGRLKQIALKQFFYSNSSIIILNIILGIIFTYHWKLIGALVATLIVWSVRTLFGFIILHRYRNA